MQATTATSLKIQYSKIYQSHLSILFGISSSVLMFPFLLHNWRPQDKGQLLFESSSILLIASLICSNRSSILRNKLMPLPEPISKLNFKHSYVEFKL